MTRSSFGCPSRLSALEDEDSSRWTWLTQVAFVIVIAVVITRMTSVEMLRDPWGATPGATATPRGPGPASSLVLDLLGIVPALLVLFRRVVDRSYRLIVRHYYLLGVLALFSTLWAPDKFAALIGGAQLFSGLCLCWAVSQIVRDGLHLRLVAAVCFGLLLVLVAQSLIYRAIDVPANNRYWTDHRTEILQEHNWKEGSFSAEQFEHKILSGELVGFFSSANSFAAVGVMLFTVSAGIGVQKIKDGDGFAWLVIPLIALASMLWIIIEARSKAAGATPLLGAALFLVVYFFRSTLRRRSAFIYWMAVFFVSAVLVSIIGWGAHHHGLFAGHFSNSLDFRWKYWIASMNVFRDHPMLGVGWNNFSLYYLAHRLPAAAEEIKDPHNFLVHFFVELGVVGGTMMLFWLLKLAWEITRPRPDLETAPEPTHTTPTITFAIVLVCTGMFLSILVNIDFTQIPADVILELLRRLLYLLALILGTVAGSMITPHRRDLDVRPAPWLFYCIAIALLLLLVHNLIDFSIFEPGPMFLFFLLAGSLLGLAPADLKRSSSYPVAIIAIVLLAGFWMVGVGWTGQVIVAEQSAYDASQDIRTAPIDDRAMQQTHFARAAAELRSALDDVPFNADYALRCTRALLSAGEFQQADAMLERTIQINPMLIDAYLLQANVQLRKPAPDAELIRADFEKILRLNPNDVSLHTQYGQALEQLGMPQLARAEYELALQYNSALPAGEPKRLDSAQLNDLEERIKRIGK